MPTNRTRKQRHREKTYDQLPPDVLYRCRHGYSVKAPYEPGIYGWWSGHAITTSDLYDDVFFAFREDKIVILEGIWKEYREEICEGLDGEPYIIEWLEYLRSGGFA